MVGLVAWVGTYPTDRSTWGQGDALREAYRASRAVWEDICEEREDLTLASCFAFALIITGVIQSHFSRGGLLWASCRA